MQQHSSLAKKHNYVQSGIPGHSAPGGKKTGGAGRFLRALLLICVALALIVAVVYGISLAIGGGNDIVYLNARVTDNIQAFGENVLYYDGATLYCVKPNGASKWAFTLGPSANFTCTETMVIAWSGSQLHILTRDGVPTYSDRLENSIRFARVGAQYAAVCMGTETSGTVRVMTHTGAVLENDDYTDLYMLDAGFFAPREQYLWTLGLDVGGNAPISRIRSYEPGRAFNGAVELDDEVVYRIFPHSNLLMVIDTSKIRAFNYKLTEQPDVPAVSVYGWSAQAVRAVGKTTYTLLTQMPTADAPTFSELRVAPTSGAAYSLRLLSPCFAGALGDKGVYGFGPDVVYFAPYGATLCKATHLTYAVSSFVCLLNGGRAVMTYGDRVFIMKLPE
ncbi:hypothetical protein FACS1894196_1830 [Clostridia bacterium]|nr:hypothetical protein FACS1894196_1800 [Clostridia bacterium]GHU82852.1 hypothetical protein FACS1894196_1830 [Clostridia bacterium]